MLELNLCMVGLGLQAEAKVAKCQVAACMQSLSIRQKAAEAKVTE